MSLLCTPRFQDSLLCCKVKLGLWCCFESRWVNGDFFASCSLWKSSSYPCVRGHGAGRHHGTATAAARLPCTPNGSGSVPRLSELGRVGVSITTGLRKGSGCASGTTRSALCSVLPCCSRASPADGGTLLFRRLFGVNFPVNAAVALVPGGLLSEMSRGKHLFPAPSRYRHPGEALGSLSWNSSGSLPSAIFLDRAVISSRPPV